MKWWHWIVFVFLPVILLVWLVVTIFKGSQPPATAAPGPQGTSGYLQIPGFGSVNIGGL